MVEEAERKKTIESKKNPKTDTNHRNEYQNTKIMKTIKNSKVAWEIIDTNKKTKNASKKKREKI